MWASDLSKEKCRFTLTSSYMYNIQYSSLNEFKATHWLFLAKICISFHTGHKSLHSDNHGNTCELCLHVAVWEMTVLNSLPSKSCQTGKGALCWQWQPNSTTHSFWAVTFCAKYSTELLPQSICLTDDEGISSATQSKWHRTFIPHNGHFALYMYSILFSYLKISPYAHWYGKPLLGEPNMYINTQKV